MRETGIVRRIDELGRVVIPKEIRKTQRIRTGDSLEIYTDGNGDDMLPVTDGHGAAQPPGQHVRIDGGRLAKLGQRRILFKYDLAVAVRVNFE